MVTSTAGKDNGRMKRKTKKLTDHELNLLTAKFSPISFAGDSDIVYEDQVPNTGVVLLEGEAVITRKKKVLDPIEPGTVLGVNQLMENEAVKHGCRIREKAKVILLHRSDLNEIIDDEDPTLKKAIMP